MKKFFLASAAVLAFGVNASAADLRAKAPVYKAPVALPVSSWTGFYLGIGAGYGTWMDPSGDVVFANGFVQAFNQPQGGKGWFGTVIGGFDYQFGRFVAGVSTDFDFGSLKGNVHDEFPFWVGEMTMRSAWSAGGRFGYLLMPTSLLYVTGGWSQARFSGSSLGLSIAPFTPNQANIAAHTYNGWYAGMGLETQLGNNWSVRGEYRYADYGSAILPEVPTAPGLTDALRMRPTAQTFRVDVAYKFGGQAFASAAPAVDYPPAFSWTGFYLGVGAGYGTWIDPNSTILNSTATAAIVNQPQAGKGWLGSIIAGYDYQFAGPFVAGVYTDFDFSRIRGYIEDDGPVWGGAMTLQSAWSVGGRLGYLVVPSSLAYATGGYTRARFSDATLSDTFTLGAPGVARATVAANTYSGWFLGAGLETQIAANWSVRGEYRYADFGSSTLVEVIPGGGGDLIRFHPTVQTYRMDVTYKFGAPAAVVAKY